MKIEGNIVDVVNRTINKGEIIVENGIITEIHHKPVKSNFFILPGLVDAHVHIESSMMTPSQFARIAVCHGTVASVSDPHEIANVCGMDGIEFMLENGKTTPYKFFFGAPSCVPATSFETSGFTISAEDIGKLLNRNDIHYLSEMMNFPGVIFDDAEVLEKLKTAKKSGKPVDGHAPALNGKNLEKYVSSGISTDHECFSLNEAIEKIGLGMKILIREGSAAKNFDTLKSLIDSHNEKVMLCSDDLHPDDLVKGHINLLIKKGIDSGINIMNLLRAATLNPKSHYSLNNGLLQKGDAADFIVVDNLNSFNILETYIDGNKVFTDKKTMLKSEKIIEINNFNCNTISAEDIKIYGQKSDTIKIIDIIDGELITKKIIAKATIINGEIVPDLENDYLKIVVINRYQNAKPSVGFIHNFGFKKGAICGSIAHDSHNIICVGTNDVDIANAINKVIENKGGLCAIDGQDCTILPLQIGGIMSDEDGFIVAEKYKNLEIKAKEFGSHLKSPFMTLSFMALLVIPELKIGDKGLFDGNNFCFTSLID